MDNNKLQQKYNKLLSIIENYESAIVAYSGGVDSTLVLKVSKDVLNCNVLAVCASSSTYTRGELIETQNIVDKLGVKFKLIETDELSNEKFVANTPDRCFYCKSELYSKLMEIANQDGYSVIFDGSNLDDMDDYRPGRIAAKNYSIISPLILAGFTKDDVRQVSRFLNIPTWNKPAMACLASRFPYGSRIVDKEISKVASAERYLQNCGLRDIRLRNYGRVGRIEVSTQDIDKFKNIDFRYSVLKNLKKFGFKKIIVDFEGYRTGSMNQILDNEEYKKEGIVK